MRWIIALLLIILTYLQYRLWFGPGSWAEVASLQRDLETQLQKNTELKARNHTLAIEIDRLKHNLESIEERARRELGMIKEGETFYLLVEDEKK